MAAGAVDAHDRDRGGSDDRSRWSTTTDTPTSPRMFNEQKRRVPEEDTLTVVPGFLGAYPNALFKVTSKTCRRFVDAVTRLSSEADYAALMSRYGRSAHRPGASGRTAT